jgi:hypothetical protein
MAMMGARSSQAARDPLYQPGWVSCSLRCHPHRQYFGPARGQVAGATQGSLSRMKKVWLDVASAGKSQEWALQERGGKLRSSSIPGWASEMSGCSRGLKSIGEKVIHLASCPSAQVDRRATMCAALRRNRSMSKDDEYLPRRSERMVCLTMIRLMLKRLARAAQTAKEQAWQTHAKKPS